MTQTVNNTGGDGLVRAARSLDKDYDVVKAFVLSLLNESAIPRNETFEVCCGTDSYAMSEKKLF